MLSNFKETIKSKLLYINWNPTDKQLLDIAKKLSNLPIQANNADIITAIHEVCGNISAISLEGEDHADLNILLLLARNIEGK